MTTQYNDVQTIRKNTELVLFLSYGAYGCYGHFRSFSVFGPFPYSRFFNHFPGLSFFFFQLCSGRSCFYYLVGSSIMPLMSLFLGVSMCRQSIAMILFYLKSVVSALYTPITAHCMGLQVLAENKKAMLNRMLRGK